MSLRMRAYFHQLNPVTDQEFEELLRYCTYRRLRKYQHLLVEGQPCEHVYFVLSGCLRLHKTDSSGRDQTLELAIQNDFLSDRISLSTRQPSEFGIDAVTNCEVMAIDANITAAMQHSPTGFGKRIGIIMQMLLAKHQRRITTLLTLTAEERYIELLTTQPRLVEMVPQHMIASYLGITPSTLSRVRKQLEAGGIEIDKLADAHYTRQASQEQ